MDIQVRDFGKTTLDLHITVQLGRQYYINTNNCKGLIFVVDSNDKDRINEAYDEFHKCLWYLKNRNNIPILLICNKQDIPNAMTLKDIQYKMGFYRVRS